MLGFSHRELFMLGNAAPPILETPDVFIGHVAPRQAADDDKRLQLRASYVIKLTHLAPIRLYAPLCGFASNCRIRRYLP